jgi:lycopene cyclase domain-containing protein
MGTLCAAIGMGMLWQQPWIRHWRRSISVLLTVIIPFIIWDVFATRVGHWGFNAHYTLGPSILGLPLEEIGFFVAVSLAALAIWEKLQQVHRKRLDSAVLIVPGALALALGFVWPRGYSIAVTLAALSICACLYYARQWLLHRGWFYYQIILLLLFFIFNSVLTSLPIVTYGAEHFSGVRIGTIPIEDFLYNFALVNLVALVSTAYDKKRRIIHSQS